MADEDYCIYYHHTDKASAKQILESGYIKQSDPKQGDAVHGPATYVTTVGPEKSRKEVAKNNYDGATSKFYESKIHAGKTEVAFEMKMKKKEVEPCDAGGRDIFAYRGNLQLTTPKELNVCVRRKDGGLDKYEHKK